MARILTGIQSTGKPHLGNLLGAILPAIELSRNPQNESILFIADMHSLTTVKDPVERLSSMRAVAAAWLAFGFDVRQNILFCQSHVPQVAELTWYLSCFTPYPMLANAHSFKDKADRLAEVNAGLFIYPVLMAADILLYDANIVPVGRDQKQHLEMARDMAAAVNNYYQQPIFTLPEARIDEAVMTIPGTDGLKMSKSYKNVIDMLAEEKVLRKQIMGIVTDSSPLEAPKNPDTDTVYKLYHLLAPASEAAELRQRYLAGGMGYGHAKQALFEVVMERFAKPRAEFANLMANPAQIDEVLAYGAHRAKAIADPVLNRVRQAMGFR